MASSDEHTNSNGDSPKAPVVVEPVPRATKKARLASEELVKQTVIRCMDCANRAAWNDPYLIAHMAPNFQWESFNDHKETNREEHLAYMQSVSDKNPEFFSEILDLSVDVQEKLGRAKVWCMLNVTGWPKGVSRETLHIFFCRRDEHGEWIVTRHHGFSGVAPLPLPFDVADWGDEC